MRSQQRTTVQAKSAQSADEKTQIDWCWYKNGPDHFSDRQIEQRSREGPLLCDDPSRRRGRLAKDGKDGVRRAVEMTNN